MLETTRRPGAELPPHLMWMPRMQEVEGQMKEVGVTDPDGKYHPLYDDETFVLNRGEKGDYEAIIVSEKHGRRVLKEFGSSEIAEPNKLPIINYHPGEQLGESYNNADLKTPKNEQSQSDL